MLRAFSIARSRSPLQSPGSQRIFVKKGCGQKEKKSRPDYRLLENLAEEDESFL
jgi:hypothetical protein